MTPRMGEHERAYLAEIRRHLWNVPSMDRRPLLEQAADHLAERPPAESERGLAEALGKPGEYAATLRREAGLPTRFSRWQRLRGQQRRILLAEMTAIATLVIGSIGAWVWVYGRYRSCTASAAEPTPAKSRRAKQLE